MTVSLEYLLYCGIGCQITLEWHQHAQRTGEDAISGGHKGPVQVYVAKVKRQVPCIIPTKLIHETQAPSTAASFDGQGTVWTKVYSSGLLSNGSWATDVVNANNGKHSFVLPKSLPNGD